MEAALTVRPVAEMLGLSDDTVRRWADSGILPALRLPSGHRRFERAAVEALRERIIHGART
ncbi:MAG: helix-turn-helix domain-containing protein [Tepidiformaceae bacterium]